MVIFEPTPTLRLPPVGICAAVREGLGPFCLGFLGLGVLGDLGAAGLETLGVGLVFGFDLGGMINVVKKRTNEQ